MKTLATLFFLIITTPAHAVILDASLRSSIKDACLVHHQGQSDANRFCGCVGTRHFRSAKQMPDAARANRDLKWVLAYYRASNATTVARLRADPDNLSAYDAFIGKQCRSVTAR